MSALIPTAPTMTSREIAELTGKEHRNVLADIRRMLQELGADPKGYAEFSAHPQNGQKYEISRLPKDLTLTLVAGYNVVMRKRIIDRWLKLEAAPVFTLPKTYSEALRALADSSENVAKLETKIVADAPKVEFAEAVRDLDGVCPVEAVAKTLGEGRNKFFKRLREDAVLMPNNLPYQKYIDRNYFKVVEQEPWLDKEGRSHPVFTSMVTGRGQVWLQRKYANQRGANGNS